MIIFNGITHATIAVTLYYLTFGFDPYNMTAIVFGSLLPDIDTPHSILGRLNIFSYVMKHRGITHTLIAAIIFSWIVYSIFDNFVYGFIFGYIFHLLLDTLTPMGIMWLYPFRKKHYSLLPKSKSY